MAGLSNFEVPDYIKPPSPAQAEQLGMERDQLEMQQAQMLQRGFEKMQKKVAMARVMGDAAELQAAGLDPEEARSQALLKSGKGLFDTPEEWNKVSTNLEDSIARKRATQSFHNEVQNLISNGKDPQDALSEAYAKWGTEIAGRTGIQPFINAQTRASTAAKTLTEKRDEFKAREDRLKNFEADRKDLGQQRVDLGYYKADTSADTADLARTSREKIATKSETGKERRAKAALLLKAEADPQIKAIDASIADATTTLAEKQQSPKWHWLTDEAGVKKSIEDLKAQRAKRLKELGVDDSTENAPSKSSKVLKWNPQTNSLEE